MRYKVRRVSRIAACLCACCAITAVAEGAGRSRLVYNPVTQQTEPDSRVTLAFETPQIASRAEAVPTEPAPQVSPVLHTEQVSHDQVYSDDGLNGDGGYLGGECGSGIGCGDGYCDTTCGDVCGPVSCVDRAATFYTGFEFTFLKPHFDDNAAYTHLDGNATGDSVFTDVSFDHDTELAPRAYFGWRHCDGVGLRATWWSFDHEAESVSASPDADGFGSISPPSFAGVDADISTVIPTDVFSASSDLEATAVDIEATQQASLCGWDIVVAGGLRYAEVEQGYRAQTVNSTNAQRGTVDYRQSIDGIGPTISLGASRPFGRRATIFCRGRGSVLFGDGDSTFTAAENIDAPPEIATSRTTNRDDLLSIGEVQVGFRWSGRGRRHLPYKPFVSLALEGQVWNGAGSATSEDGSLGFFGGVAGVGLEW